MKQQTPLSMQNSLSPSQEQATTSTGQSAQNTLGNQAVQSSMQNITYTVAKGDSLWKIAQKILGDGSKYMEIAKANHIQNPNAIQVGQQLTISKKVSAPKSASHTSTISETEAKKPVAQPSAVAQETQNDRDAKRRFLQQERADLAKLLSNQQGSSLVNTLLCTPGNAGKTPSLAPKTQNNTQTQATSDAAIEKNVQALPAEPKNLLKERALEFVKKHPKRESWNSKAGKMDATSWNGWCASLMFRFGKETSGFKDGKNDAPDAISASKKSKIVSKDPKQAPKGAFHWWDIGAHGHVGLDVSGGGTEVFMASGRVSQFIGKKENAVGLVSVEQYSKAIGKKTYLGWSMDYVGGKIDEKLVQ
jgi:LysM repeat protein